MRAQYIDEELKSYPEHLLAFRLDPEVREFRVNPRTPPIRQLSLTRETTASNFVPASHLFTNSLSMNPTQLTAPPASSLLRINNLPESRPGETHNGFLATSVRPGRGLDELLTSCHDKFTAQDRKVFALLQRMVRAYRESFTGGEDVYDYYSESMVLFRDQDPHEYRISFSSGWHIRLHIDWTPDGRLTTGQMEVPAPEGTEYRQCDGLGYSTLYVSLLVPVAAGHDFRPPNDPRARGFCLDSYIPPPTDVDFAALLSDTAWND